MIAAIRSNFSTTTFLLATSASLAVSLVVLAVAVGPLFGYAWGPIALVLTTIVAMVATLRSAIQYRLQNPRKETAFLMAMLANLGILASMLGSSPMLDSRDAFRAKEKINIAYRTLGRTPEISSQVQAMTADRGSVAANRKYLLSIAEGNTSQEDVVFHVAMARMIGLDPAFVSANGIIRHEDRQALVDKVMNSPALAGPEKQMMVARVLSGSPPRM